MSDATSQTTYFYNRHPISCDIILAKLRSGRGHLDRVRPEELFPYDQDHYGGTAATDELAREAQIKSGSSVADFCAGLGGTVRYLAHRYGATVVGIELTPSRVVAAQELTKLVGLQDTARVMEGNVLEVPLPDASVDAVVSQEAFCHVPELRKRWSRLAGFCGKAADWLSRIGSPMSSCQPKMRNSCGMVWPSNPFVR
jgi:sarcosine/dimethylglycine N-methyltransferase